MQIHDNIDPNWAIEVCKWSVTITICSFPYIGKSKELDYVRKKKNQHEVISGSNHPPRVIHHNVEPISKVKTIYCNNGNGYFSPFEAP